MALRHFLALTLCAFFSSALAQDLRNIAAQAEGGRLFAFGSQYDNASWAAANLIDGSADKGWSAQSAGAQSVIVAFKDDQLAEIHDILINPYSREDKANWAKDVELHASSTYPFRDFRLVGKITLTPEGQDQVFSLPAPIQARYLKVVFLSNSGGSYMQAGEIKIMGRLLAGSPQPPRYSSVAAASAGAKIEKFTSQYDESSWAAKNLLEEDGANQWAGKSGDSQEIVIALPSVAQVTDISINNYAREDSKNWAKDVEVELSPTVPYKDYRAVGKLTLPPVGDLHTISLPEPVTAKYVRILFRNNRGGSYMEAARVRVFAADSAGGKSDAIGTAKSIDQQLRETGRAVVHEIHFATNSAEILPTSEAVLRTIAAVLQNDPKLELIIEGHTDSVGGAESNLDLSRRRADAVKRWLADKGGTSELRLTTIGYGLTKPIADNASEEGRAKNRRVELVKK